MYTVSGNVQNKLTCVDCVQESNDIVSLTRLTKHDLGQVCTHDVIVRVCVYVGGTVTGSCADTDVAQSRALWRCEVQLKQYTMSLQASIVKIKEFLSPAEVVGCGLAPPLPMAAYNYESLRQ